jgi:hypothetical protein
MKKRFYSLMVIFLVVQQGALQSMVASESQPQCYSWAIVGAGLAGITALAVLINCGVEPSSIAWIDTEFGVGRVGKYYRNVPGNIQISRMLLYVNNCPYFKDITSSSLQALYTYDLEEFKLLQVIADPLQDFTDYLRNQVVSVQTFITSLTLVNDQWVLEGSDCSINAQKVILAIGAEPKRLTYDIPEILLDDALDKDKLATLVSPDDTIAVFGGMHSAILVLKYLSENCSVKQIINFYIEPYFYGPPGLEGATALWAQTVLEQNPPANLSRVLSTLENRKNILPLCTKAIYAIGYEPSPILVNGSLNLTFDEYTGIIDQNLYGIGIAFPPTGIINGQKIAKNGLHAYLGYAKKLIPQWIACGKSCVQLGKDKHEDLAWI